VDFESKIHAKMILAKLALCWEALWLAFAPALLTAGLFLAYAGFELPDALFGWPEVMAFSLLALAFTAALAFGVWRFKWPEDGTAERRLEIDSEILHRPMTAIKDPLSGGMGDKDTAALWRVHRLRMIEALRQVKVGLPHPGLPARDPNGLRAIVFLLLAVSVFVAGADFMPRFARALSPTWPTAPVPELQLEAWINPPAYTGLTPVHLTRVQSGTESSKLSVPVQSELFVRLYGDDAPVELVVSGGENQLFKQVDALNHELETKLVAGDELQIHQAGNILLKLPLTLIPDRPPVVKLVTEPSRTTRGALTLEVTAEDDYGIAGLRMTMALAEGENALESKLDVLTGFDLALSFADAADGRKKLDETYYNDLTAHPWAGLRVALTLDARDFADQTGQSESHFLTLPERQFRNAVARAIIEQRKMLTRKPNRWDLVTRALAAIRANPDAYDHDFTVALGLSTSIARLRLDQEKLALISVRQLLWDLALHLEDGKLSLAERRLRQAEDELMEALARDASDEEIERLMEQLSRAMEEFLQAMAEEAMKKAMRGEPTPETDQDSQQVQKSQFDEMMERIKELSKLGAKDAAMEMLRQMRAMLENLRANPQFGQNDNRNQMNETTKKLSDLLRKQQQLMDQTLRQNPSSGQRRPQPGQPQQPQGQQGRPGPQSEQSLAEQQEALRRQLGELMRQMGEGDGEIPDPLGKAERAMRDARQALNGNSPGEAMGAQGQAVDQLAKGIQSMMSRGQGEEGEEGEGSAGNNSGEDPAGRPRQSGAMDSGFVHIPTESDVQRSRQILNELRKRAGERDRPRQELDYIDRLIEPF
jgi:uncharacterized protein (TIGR02302 family)